MNNGTRTVALTGDDSVVLDGTSIADFAEGTISDLNFDAEIANLKAGKGGNAIIAPNAQGNVGSLRMRLIRGSADDRFLNDRQRQQLADLPSFVLIEGQIVKRVGDGGGGVTYETYIVSGGIFTRQVGNHSNVEGETDQAVAVYEIKFANVVRAHL
jgi:hypothetical protein